MILTVHRDTSFIFHSKFSSLYNESSGPILLWPIFVIKIVNLHLREAFGYLGFGKQTMQLPLAISDKFDRTSQDKEKMEEIWRRQDNVG